MFIVTGDIPAQRFKTQPWPSFAIINQVFPRAEIAALAETRNYNIILKCVAN